RLNNVDSGLANSTTILLDYSLNPGSGAGDMFLYVQNSAFSNDPNSNIILYSQFGNTPGGDPSTTNSTNDGIEEWAVLQPSSVAAVPVPPAILLLVSGAPALCLGWFLRRRQKAAA